MAETIYGFLEKVTFLELQGQPFILEHCQNFAHVAYVVLERSREDDEMVQVH